MNKTAYFMGYMDKKASWPDLGGALSKFKSYLFPPKQTSGTQPAQAAAPAANQNPAPVDKTSVKPTDGLASLPNRKETIQGWLNE